MKKKKITYGVFGMMEYQSIIKIGRATLKVLFTDGSITSLGQNPAHYTTSDFLVQHAIENSRDFKRGRIRVVNAIELDEEVRIERNHTASAQTARAKVAASPAVKVEKAADSAAPAKEEDTVVEDVAGSMEAVTGTAPDATEATTEATGEAEDKAAEGAATPTEVEFCTNQEAKDYLANTFGVKGALKTRAEIIAAGETYGVKISFVKD
ncbi:hypothetical protein [Prevotellamassilia timonensis]|uniref:hypothetical protein n=1 Tax=Prevotellamassilia timonensis TaxID=1852370 RepID=UPI0008D9E8F0|nr:hypothetical protein [Prevotellamassilia timonensis]